MRDGIHLGEKHTVFGLSAMVGLSITLLIKKKELKNSQIWYDAVDWKWTREEKFAFLEKVKSVGDVNWKPLVPDSRINWLVPLNAGEFDLFIPLGNKQIKSGSAPASGSIFKTHAL